MNMVDRAQRNALAAKFAAARLQAPQRENLRQHNASTPVAGEAARIAEILFPLPPPTWGRIIWPSIHSDERTQGDSPA